MRVARQITVAIGATSLALALLAPAMPASAASGFHAAFFSESSFLSLAPGQQGQFSVGFQNTGDLSWAKGLVGSGASLHTAAPLDNTTDSSAGWAQGWVAPNIYARQASDVVPPGQITYFTYNVVVPLTAAAGAHIFYGRPVIDGAGALEDFGYYQIVTVSAAGTVALSPSSASIGIGKSTTFIVTNRPDNPALTWSVGGDCGTITRSGTFTATTMTSSTAACNVVVSTNDGNSGSAGITVYGKAAAVACTADSMSIYANGVANTNVNVTSKDANGNSVANDNSTVVTFKNSNSAVGNLNTTTAQSQGGVASALFTASTAPGTTVVSATTASLGGCSVTLQTTLVGAVAHLTGSFSPSTIAADGTSTSTLTITAVDANGATLTSNVDSVRASLKASDVCTITGSNPVTLSSGTTTTTVRSTKSVGNCVVSLTDLTTPSIVAATVTLSTGVVGTANKLVVTSNDSPQRAGTSVTVKVSLQDSNNTTVFSNSTESITATPQGCSALATQSQTTVNGVATFAFSPGTAGQICTINITDATNTAVNSTSAAVSWN